MAGVRHTPHCPTLGLQYCPTLGHRVLSDRRTDAAALLKGAAGQLTSLTPTLQASMGLVSGLSLAFAFLAGFRRDYLRSEPPRRTCADDSMTFAFGRHD